MSWQIAAMAGAAAVGAVSSIASGAAQARGLRMQAGQYKQMAEEAKVQTMQEEVARRRRFLDMVGANAVEAAGRGIEMDPSGSFGAIEAESRRAFEIDTSNVRFLGEARQRQYGLAARMASKAASSAMLQGYLGAAMSVFSAGQRYYQGMPGSVPSMGYQGQALQSAGSSLSQRIGTYRGEAAFGTGG